MSANASATLLPPSTAPASAGALRFSWQDPAQRNAWIACVASAVGLVWAYWMMFVDAAEFWSQPQYSHGWVLPLIALYMMWRLRPNKKYDAQLETALRYVAGAGATLAAIGLANEDLQYLQGWGLAVVCLGGFACMLWGQPFATLKSAPEQDSYRWPAALWGIAVAGMAFAALGLLRVSAGPLPADVFSMLGMLVIIVGLVLAAVLVPAPRVLSRHEIAVGGVVILFCTLAWFTAVQFDRMPLARAAFVATAIGVLTVIGGMRLVRWAGPPVAFLMTMFPLPSLAEQRVLGSLQALAVTLSDIVYTILGVPVIRDGKQFRLPGVEQDIPMEIAQACSGLSMTNLLLAMGLAVTILMQRPWWDRVVVLLSTLPIAIIANVFRIVLTGLIWMAMDRFVSSDPQYLAELRDPVHQWIGLIVMMPFALGLIFLELKLLSMLSTADNEARPGAVSIH